MSNKKLAIIVTILFLAASALNTVQPLIGTIMLAFIGGMIVHTFYSTEDE